MAYFLGGASRAGGQQGWIETLGSNFSELPELIRRGLTPADVVFSLPHRWTSTATSRSASAPTTPWPPWSGRGPSVLEVNPNVPYAHGNCHVHLSQVAALVEGETPLAEVGLPTIGPVQEAIGRYVADMIEDGSTLQIGYGRHSRRRGHAAEAQARAGCAHRDDGRRPAVADRVRRGDEPVQELPAREVDRHLRPRLGEAVPLHAPQPGLEMHPVDFTNDPWLAARNDKLVSVNATLQIDLFGQCGSESLGPVPYSGTGGQTDFVRAANRSAGGKSFIVVPSTAKRGASRASCPRWSPAPWCPPARTTSTTS
jgi:hypothetical protein